MFRNYSDFFEEVETDKGIASEQLKKEILKKKLGSLYPLYMKRRKKVIPFVIH